MQLVRQLLAQRRLAVMICAATLLLKLLVPTGYMIANDRGWPAITLCSDTTAAPAAMAMPAMHGDMADHGKSRDHGKAEMPCAFSGLSSAMTGAIDPIQLAALIRFMVAIGLAGVVLPALTRSTYLRPPLRGPPVHL